MISTGTKTEILIEVLPYIQEYEGKTFVVKYGGAAMADEQLNEAFAQDVTLLRKIGINVVIVHGGGKEITDTAARLGLTSRFVDGLRYTDEAMMDVVQMVLAGKTNKDIVKRINQHDGDAIGLCGMDSMLLRVRRSTPGGVDLGFVGEVTAVHTPVLELLLANGYLPVVAPVGMDEDGQAYNVNADLAAGALAAALRAEKLVYLSDVEGVWSGDTLISSLTQQHAEELLTAGRITKGMIPKIRSAFDALNAGVNKVHIIDGRAKHSLLLEIFTNEGVGTEVVHDPTQSRNPEDGV